MNKKSKNQITFYATGLDRIDPVTSRFRFGVIPEDVAEAARGLTIVDTIFKNVAKDAKVAGFRPGHVPPDILQKHYSSFVHEQVLKELIPEVYNQAIQKEGLEVIELPDISDVKLDRNTLFFKAKVETMPEIAVKNYKGLKVNCKKIEVTNEEVKRNIDSLKEARKIDTLDDNFAKGLGYPNLPELERAIERQIFTQKENLQRKNLENEVIEQLTKDSDFKLPQPLIDRQLKELIQQAKVELALKGVSREEIEAQEKAFSTQLEPEAKEQVKVYLILAAIAKKENITQDDHMPHKIIEFLLREAKWQES